MEGSESMPILVSSRAEPATLPEVSRRWLFLGRALIVSAVLFYLVAVLIGPLLALAAQTHSVGVEAAFAAAFAPAAREALRMSLILTGIALVLNALVGTVGAIAIVRHRFIGREALSALCDLPLAVSPVMIGLAFLLLVGREGVLSPLLDTLGFKVVFSFPGLVIGTLFVTLPYTVKEVVYVLEEIGTSEEEAAVTLGASPWQAFWRVTLPNIRVALGYGLLMSTARSLGEFGAVLVLGGSITGQTQTATTFIHDAIEERQLTSAYGMAMILGLLSISLLLCLEWLKARQETERSRAST
jgi:sulfate/thiosulfate transport system permease protein